MKALVCEMCHSNEVVKQDGYFVCQSCGTKYSVEEAKKMMVEGTVKIDQSGNIENYYAMAESAYESNNNKEAESYCNKVIEIDPLNYKAWLLKGRSAGWQSTLANIRIEEAVNCFTKCLDNAPENEQETLKSDIANETTNLSIALLRLCCNNYSNYPSIDNSNAILVNLKNAQIYSLVLLSKCGVSADGFKEDVATMINASVVSAWQNCILKNYQDDPHPSKYVWETFKDRGFIALNLLQASIDICNSDESADIQRYKNMITLTEALVKSYSWTYWRGAPVREYSLTDEAKSVNIDNIKMWHQKIKEIDSTYEIPLRYTQQAGGCYVATAVYGSYDCPEVWVLRRFRDYTMANNYFGLIIIKVYYCISPLFVSLFGKTKIFRVFFKTILDKFVANLKAKGIEETEYEDRLW